MLTDPKASVRSTVPPLFKKTRIIFFRTLTLEAFLLGEKKDSDIKVFQKLVSDKDCRDAKSPI